MIEYLFGVLTGIILLLFIGYIDDRFKMGGNLKMSETRFKFFLIASCWELLFFIGGILLGGLIL